MMGCALVLGGERGGHRTGIASCELAATFAGRGRKKNAVGRIPVMEKASVGDRGICSFARGSLIIAP